ncbi:hypothetical protein ACRXCV_09120 [Halobacteriovorax sp. GFR7]|uniref:hypothetical protein n=1 Tax=unclassified Halobacteriovorax TaxID=2639665 RepID=UPI003D97B98F
MKNILKFILTLMVISNITAGTTNCHQYLVMSDIDGRHDITEKIINIYEEKGYSFTKIDNLYDLPQEGNVSYMTIFSDLHKYRGAYTHVVSNDVVMEKGDMTSKSENSFKITKSPLVGSWTKSLLRSVKRRVSECK